jgi:hypothetical protein
MNIFVIESNKIKVQPEALLIPQFAEIWNRDKSKEKTKAISELSFVYFMADYKSIYASYPESTRTSQIITDTIKDSSWKPDDVIKAALVKYEELQQTPTLRLLKSARHALEEACNYYNEVKPNDRNIVAISGSIEKIGKIAESLDKLEDKIKREIQTEGRSKGNREINPFES